MKNSKTQLDATDVGKENAHRCTLIITEGTSAMSLVEAGLDVVGKQYYGILALCSKLLNVRTTTVEQISTDVEINKLIDVIGLKYEKKYLTEDDLKSLRYGKVMLLTDQDPDGSHIKGLFINFIHWNWPELLRLPFLEGLITPIIKVIIGDDEAEEWFYSIPGFEEWKKENKNPSYKVIYLKGLRSSNSEEGKVYFRNIEQNRFIFEHKGSQDDDSIVLAFSRTKEATRKRKDLITEHMERRHQGLPQTYLPYKINKTVSYKSFVEMQIFDLLRKWLFSKKVKTIIYKVDKKIQLTEIVTKTKE